MGTLRVHDSATGRKEEFIPLNAGRAGLYTCGPTVWNFAHVGNFRTFLFYDLLRRHLRFSGYTVEQVMNLTDIEDRIIRIAGERKTTIRAYVAPYEAAFLEDLRTLRVQQPEHMPRATEHVPGMIAMISRLLESGHAYRAEGDVYYRIASFPTYGELAHLDRSGLRAGARVSRDDYDKESVSDFALWKGTAPGDGEVGAAWDAPFGRGRPGWHIECSVMSKAYLGDTFDIHAGGIDLLFPHHQNEVAQSEAANGVQLARHWLHAEHLADATGAKMSKRLGNIATLRDLVDAGHDPLGIRFFLLASAHYRSKLRMDEEAIRGATEQVRRLRDFSARVDRFQPPPVDDEGLVRSLGRARDTYRAALDDDLNLPQGVGFLFEAVRESNAAIDRGAAGPAARAAMRALLDEADSHLDVLGGGEIELETKVERLIAEREAARAGRDFARADAIREELRTQGIVLEDSREGVRWRKA
ncbi:MAG TPA: cysteine--tRNA ligase [Candidatus Dormibacteraeota bacterium]|nr:cysteine--tRNA ligase [Candidatus Dormibacteraeota bacterium]